VKEGICVRVCMCVYALIVVCNKLLCSWIVESVPAEQILVSDIPCVIIFSCDSLKTIKIFTFYR